MWKEILRWLVPTLVTGILMTIASGVNVTFTSNRQNAEELQNQLERARKEYSNLFQDRKKLNDSLWSAKNQLTK